MIFAERNIKLRFRQTFFGVSWVLLQPLLAMALFTAVLGNLAGLPSDGVPYAAFVLAGLAVWFPFNTAVTSAAESLVEDPELVTKVWFPRLLAPLAGILGGVVDLGISFIIALVVALVVGIPPQLALVTVPALVIFFVFIALAFGLWLSALNVLYRDVRYALGYLMQLLFFATPVVYSSSVAEGDWAALLALNPLFGLIDLFRWVLLGVPAPDYTAVISIASGALVLLGGLVFFRRAERVFADRI